MKKYVRFAGLSLLVLLFMSSAQASTVVGCMSGTWVSSDGEYIVLQDTQEYIVGVLTQDDIYPCYLTVRGKSLDGLFFLGFSNTKGCSGIPEWIHFFGTTDCQTSQYYRISAAGTLSAGYMVKIAERDALPELIGGE